MAEEQQEQEQDQNQIIRQEKTEIPDATSSNEEPPSSSTASSSSCPFSKTFPRYRIDLISSRKNRNKNNKKQKEGLWQLIPDVPSFELPSLELPSPPWKEAMQRDKVERALQKRQKRTTGSAGTNGDGLEIVIQPDIDGVKAFAFLWEESARLMGLREGYVSSSTSTSSSVVILGLPDASQTVVQNFCEIVEWMETNLETENSDSKSESNYFASAGVGERFVLSAEFIKEENLDIPAVRLERISWPPPPGPPSDSDKGDTTNGHNNNNESIIKSSPLAAAENIINERTRLWVKRILVEQGICPFTRSDRMSGQGLVDMGVPAGSIAYHASFQKHPIGLFADTWKAIDRMLEAGPAGRLGVSSILLAAPEYDADFELWAGPIFAMLEAGVVAAEAESQVGVVCFHPLYATPDGKSWPGFGHMHSVPRLEKWYRETTNESAFPGSSLESSSESSSEESCMLTTEQIAAGGAWQRRTPHATINVLRADQLEVAESRRVSGKMYTENIDKLVGVNGIGNEKLARDLEREREQGANQL